jgi:hypothetical protein
MSHWVDSNESDPGTAVVEFFAFLAEALAAYAEQDRLRRRRRALLPAALAGVGLVFWTTRKCAACLGVLSRSTRVVAASPRTSG